MTIKVKQHYRTVNGKLVLVHEHEHKGEAAHHEPAHLHEKAVDDEFEKLFGGHEPEQAAAPEPDVDSEFDKLFGGDAVDSEFDKLFGGPEGETEAPAKDEPASSMPTAAEMEGIGGKPWKEKGHDRIYFNGLHKLYLESDGPHKDVPFEQFKGAKLWFDNKDGQFHSKNLNDFYLDSLVKHITKKAKEWGTQNEQTMEDPAATETDFSTGWSPFKPGEKVPFDNLKIGMKLKGTQTGNVYTLDDVSDNYASGITDTGVEATFYKDEWDKTKLVYAGDGEPVETTPKDRVDSGPKIGETPKFDQIQPGMVLTPTKSGTVTNVVLEVGPDSFWAQTPNGTVHEYSQATWDVKAAPEGIQLTSMDGADFETSGILAPDLHVGDTKTINGVTYQLNANHRWEKVEGATQDSQTLKTLQDLGGWDTTTINGISIKKHSPYNNLYAVYKNDADGKPLSKKMKDAIAELHPDGYMKKKAYFLVHGDKLAELSAAIDGKVAAKPKAKTEKKPKIVPVSAAEGFPFKQVGPQAGSNPGGLYEDAYGKKWYIKFPPSEDHAKNELLASKLYKIAGVDAPRLKLVKKDGQIGIASAFQEGLTNNGAALKAGAPGAKDGFGVDAWLANWDSAGLSFDNMPVDKEGKALRIDVGGSLLYRAQGGAKGDAFGNVVTEIDTLRDPKSNANTAAIFGGMTQEELDLSVSNVLSVPDEAIEAAVMKFGPGDDAAKKDLIKKLKARKAYLAKRFPGADRLANPPMPDPTQLKVDPAKIKSVPDFKNWNGTGKGLSGVEAINDANQQACQEVYDFAMKGNLVALKAMKMAVVDKNTGTVELKPAYEHPSSKVREYFDTLVGDLEVIANPASKKAKAWDLEDAEDINELADAFKPHHYGVSVGKVPANERLGFWIALGNAADPQQFAPKDPKDVSSTLKSKGKQDYAKMPSVLTSWLSSVQGSGSNNQPYRDGLEKDYQGRDTREVLEAAYKHATEFPEGSTIRKWIDFPSDMLKQLQDAPDGHVFQNPGSMCCSMSTDWEGGKGKGFGDHMLTIRYAKGAKGLATFGSGSFGSEQEITTMPGQRFMILNKGKTKYGTLHLELLMLPPDETYISNIKTKQVAA